MLINKKRKNSDVLVLYYFLNISSLVRWTVLKVLWKIKDHKTYYYNLKKRTLTITTKVLSVKTDSEYGERAR